MISAINFGFKFFLVKLCFMQPFEGIQQEKHSIATCSNVNKKVDLVCKQNFM